MTSRRKSEACRICGGDLQGNQRRWLFAAQNRKGGKTHSSTHSVSKESTSTHSPTRSSQGSPWGSTLSLGSSYSLNKSHTLPTPTKGMDPLAVLTHILGQSLSRGNGQGEFICGKCVSVLERVFKFDTVITRVRVLSRERLQKLTQERDNLRRWVRGIYRQHHPSDLRNRGSSSEEDLYGRNGGTLADTGRAYHEMLSDNMAFAGYECWSEKSESCPYFKRTGKRCGKMKNCDCCDSLRVSDSDYESVCGVPRHVPHEASSPFGLSRDKSQSLPLPWSKPSSPHSSPASLAGSCQSLQSQTHKASSRSLNSLDGQDSLEWPEEHPVVFDSILTELRNIEGKPVRSPVGSRIPVLAKGQNGAVVSGSHVPGLVRELDFGEDNEDEMNGQHDDILTELRDEFLPLQKEASSARMHLAIMQLREQLDQAQARIKTLEAGPQVTTQLNSSSANQPSPPTPVELLNNSSEDDRGLIRNLSYSLQSKDKVIQECVTLIQKLCIGVDETDKLVNILTVTLTNTRSDKEVVLEAELSELREKERGLQKKLEVLQQAARGRERDLLTLNTVLQSNQDVISVSKQMIKHLRVDLAENTKSLQDVQKERQFWKEHNSVLEAMLQEKDSLISHLQVALESAHKDAQALSDSLIGQGLEGGGAKADLASQVREQEVMLSKCLNDWEQHTFTTREEVSKLCTALENAEALIQDQRQRHTQVITELSAQLRDAHKELQETLRDIKLSEQGWKTEKSKRDLEEGRLKECLLKRDKLIEQVLLDAEKRDGMLIELQQNISSKIEPKVSLKHTL